MSLTGVREIKDVPYCSESTDVGIDPFRTLDLYIPEALFDHCNDNMDDDTQSKPKVILVLFVHGGAWRTGDKSAHVHLARSWASPGSSTSSSSSSSVDDERNTFVIVAVPNYRLSPIVKHPVHANDIHTALRFLLTQPHLPDFIGKDGGGFTSSFEYSSV